MKRRWLVAILMLCIRAYGACSNTALANGVVCVQSKTGFTNGGSGTCAVTFNSAVTSGNAVMWFGGSGGTTGTGITDDKSNTYTSYTNACQGNGCMSGFALNVTNGPTTITGTFGANNTQLCVAIEVSGVSSLDSGAIATAQSASPWTSANITDNHGTDGLFCYGVNFGTTTGAITSTGWTQLDINSGLGTFVVVGGITETVAATYTCGGTAGAATTSSTGFSFVASGAAAAKPCTITLTGAGPC